MPQEIRRIEFQHDELVDALLTYHARTGGRHCEAADVRRLHVSEAAKGSVRLELFDKTSIRFGETEIVAALILFCADEKIPLPRNASKSLRTSDELVSLTISTPHVPSRVEKQRILNQMIG